MDIFTVALWVILALTALAVITMIWQMEASRRRWEKAQTPHVADVVTKTHHVVPTAGPDPLHEPMVAFGDDIPHELDPACWCIPKIMVGPEGTVVVHNAINPVFFDQEAS